MHRQSMIPAMLAVTILLAGCDGKSPDQPGNPLPPQKPPTPKVSTHGARVVPAIWWIGAESPATSPSRGTSI